MTTIIIILLVISQLISFYFIILLNTKVSKFKDLEVRQEKLLREMDDTIAAYLLEMREENDRFIKELSQLKKEKINVGVSKGQADETQVIETDEEKLVQPIPPNDVEPIDIKIEQKNLVPKNVAVSAYSKQKTVQHQTQNDEIDGNEQSKHENTEPATLEEKVIKLYNEGKSIEEIAKITEKGKTEIELLLKFHT